MRFALRVLRMQIGYPADLSARQPRYFLLHRQKEKATRMLLFPALLAFERGCRKGLPAPSSTRRIPAGALAG